jgi:hypothetical protein
MRAEHYILGLFTQEKRAIEVIKAMGTTPWKVDRVYSPFPSHEVAEALKLKKSKVGYYTLAGGILGFLTGLSLAIFTATRWDLIVGGKPIVSWIPFFVVGFEFTILFGVCGNVLGLLLEARLPDIGGLRHYDPRCSAEHFGILTSCEPGEVGKVTDLFARYGGESKIFDESTLP